MPDAADVRRIARRNFEEAHAALDADLAASSTPAQARAIMENHDRAMALYLGSLSATLECADGDWGIALAAAEEAHAALLRDREEAEDVAGRIRSIAPVTESVGNLLKAAA